MHAADRPAGSLHAWPTAAGASNTLLLCAFLFGCCLQECEALGVAAPVLIQLEETAADIAAVKGSWVVYQDFLAERDGLAHKDWLSMRDQVCVTPGVCAAA